MMTERELEAMRRVTARLGRMAAEMRAFSRDIDQITAAVRPAVNAAVRRRYRT